MADNTEDEFPRKVYAFIEDDALDVRVDRLATQFETTCMTVRRWADGRVRPRPSTQKLVLEWIKGETR